MKKNTTTLLNSLLKSTSFKNYMESNGDQMIRSSLPERLEELLLKSGLKKSAVIRGADISEIYGYQIFSGARRPERKKLLRLLIAMRAEFSDVQNTLKSFSYPQLYAKDPTDCVIIYGLCNHLDVMAINDLLFEYGRELI